MVFYTTKIWFLTTSYRVAKGWKISRNFPKIPGRFQKILESFQNFWNVSEIIIYWKLSTFLQPYFYMKLILRQDTTLFFMHWSVLWFLAFCNVLFHTNVGLDNNSISIYIAIQYFSITVIWFLNISNISVYITSVSHTLIYHSLTLLNKHVSRSKRGAGVLYECIFEGNRLSSEKFRWRFHFIW